MSFTHVGSARQTTGGTSSAISLTPDSGIPNEFELVHIYISANSAPVITPDQAWDFEWSHDLQTDESAFEFHFYKIATASEPATYTFLFDTSVEFQAELEVFSADNPIILGGPITTHWNSTKTSDLVCGAANGVTVGAGGLSIITGSKDRETGSTLITTADNSYIGVNGSQDGRVTARAYRIYTAETTISGNISMSPAGTSDNTFSTHIWFKESGGASVPPSVFQNSNQVIM